MKPATRTHRLAWLLLWGGLLWPLAGPRAQPASPAGPAALAASAATPALPMDAAAQEAQTRAVRLLEGIQQQTFSTLGMQPRVYDEAFLALFSERFLQSSMAQAMTPKQRQDMLDDMRRTARSTLKSRYEDPFGYRIVESLDAKIRAVIARSSVKLEGVPVFGTLPTRRVNARTFAVPGTNNVVIAFEDQMFNLALLFSKAAVNGFPGERNAAGGSRFSTKEDEIRKKIETDGETLRRFQEVLLAYIYAGTPGDAPQYFQAEPHATMASMLRESLELFVLGHEYGHFIARHLQDGRQVRAAIGERSYTEIRRSWEDEFEADLYGLQLGMAAMRDNRVDDALSYWGADFFFTTLDTVDRALRVASTGKEEPADADAPLHGTHPPAAVRREFLRQAVQRLHGDKAKDMVDLAVKAQFAVELMWSRTKPLFERAHAAGRPVHRLWQP